jgi:nicotinamide-nucleotide amidase
MKKEKNYRVEIMAVGSELLTPHFQDTNSLYLTQRLNELGREVSFKTIVRDDWNELTLCINDAISRSDLIIATGGLGPTRDDLTREALAHVLSRKLLFREELLQRIRERFERRSLEMPDINKKQAYVIEGSEVLPNKNGTAPGLWLEIEKKIIILLPGPPHELKPMFDDFVWPKLKKLKVEHASRAVLKTTGLTESEIESLIFDLYPKTPDVKMTTLAYPGQIEIHLTARSKKSQKKAAEKISELKEAILQKLQKNVFSQEGEELEEVVGYLLREDKKTLAVAESCTGGLVGHRITNVPGSSDYFIQGVIAYSNEAKKGLLDVPSDLIEKHGAVSYQVAQAMAQEVRKKAQADLGVGITGIAGPTGASPEKPVGLVYIALAWGDGCKVTKNLFLGKREAIKFQSSQKALDMIRRYLLKSFIKLEKK